MTIIEIITQENGSHRNQTGTFETIPGGWAVVPDDLNTENFPFGEIEVEEIDGVMTVAKWVAGTIPETPETPEPSEVEKLRADVEYIAIMTGVEL